MEQTTEVLEEVQPTDGGWHVRFESKTGIYIPVWTGVELAVGDTVELHWLHGSGLGGRLRAAYKLEATGELLLFSKTDEYLEAERAEWKAQLSMQREREFVLEADRWQRELDGLPDALQQRMRRFIGEAGGFKAFFVDGGSYELFCCTEAAKLVRAMQERPLEPAELLRYRKLPQEEVEQELGVQLDDGHSGNTWGGAFGLAYGVLKGWEV